MPDETVFNLGGGWMLRATRRVGEGDVYDAVTERTDGRFFRVETNRDGFDRPMIQQVGDGGKIGDVVVELRLDHNGFWCVRTEPEVHYTVINEGVKKANVRLKRASISNDAPVGLDATIKTGEINADSQRIAGLPIFTHFRVTDWDPETADEMVPIASYVTTLDGPGFAALLLALVAMPDALMAHTILDQVRRAR